MKNNLWFWGNLNLVSNVYEQYLKENQENQKSKKQTLLPILKNNQLKIEPKCHQGDLNLGPFVYQKTQ